MSKTEISKKNLLKYASLSLPISFAGIPIYINAPDFYSTEYNLSLTFIGISLLFLRVIDAIQDPIIGFLSDKFQKNRLKIMNYSSIILIISFFYLFNPNIKFLNFWFIICIFLTSTTFSILSINLNTLGAIWSKNSYLKTKIVAYREAIGIIGLILAVTIPNILIMTYEKQKAFFILGIIFAIISLFSYLIFASWYKNEKLKPIIKKEKLSFSVAFQSNNKMLFLIFLISMLGSSLPAILVIFFIRDLLGAENLTGLFLITYFLFAILGMPIWQILTKKNSKIMVWIFSMVFAIIVFSFASLLKSGDIIGYLIICALSGIAFGADLIIPPSILADFIQNKKESHRASTEFGIFAFLLKLALALAAIIAFPILDLAGFIPGEKNSKHAIFTLSFLYALLPCLLKVIAIILNFKCLNIIKTQNP